MLLSFAFWLEENKVDYLTFKQSILINPLDFIKYQISIKDYFIEQIILILSQCLSFCGFTSLSSSFFFC